MQLSAIFRFVLLEQLNLYLWTYVDTVKVAVPEKRRPTARPAKKFQPTADRRAKSAWAEMIWALPSLPSEYGESKESKESKEASNLGVLWSPWSPAVVGCQTQLDFSFKWWEPRTSGPALGSWPWFDPGDISSGAILPSKRRYRLKKQPNPPVAPTSRDFVPWVQAEPSHSWASSNVPAGWSNNERNGWAPVKYSQSHNDAQSWVIPSNKSDDYISPGKTPLVIIIFSSKPSHLMTSATLHLFTREQRSSLDRKSSLLKTWPRNVGESPLFGFQNILWQLWQFKHNWNTIGTIWNPLSFPFVVHSMVVPAAHLSCPRCLPRHGFAGGCG